MAVQTPLKCGVLICDMVQLLDLAAIDVLSMITKPYLRLCGLPDDIVSKGPEIEFTFIINKVGGATADAEAPAKAAGSFLAPTRAAGTAGQQLLRRHRHRIPVVWE